jgi:hypothetical protein
MPGHIKLTKGQVDPDPTEFLVPNIEMKRQAVNISHLLFLNIILEQNITFNLSFFAAWLFFLVIKLRNAEYQPFVPFVGGGGGGN